MAEISQPTIKNNPRIPISGLKTVRFWNFLAKNQEIHILCREIKKVLVLGGEKLQDRPYHQPGQARGGSGEAVRAPVALLLLDARAMLRPKHQENHSHGTHLRQIQSQFYSGHCLISVSTSVNKCISNFIKISTNYTSGRFHKI